jgi:hypothetical protein
MSRVVFAVVLMSALAAGCAGQRDKVALTANAPATPVTSAAPAEPVAADAVTVVDGNQLAARSGDTLLCRDLLIRGSNVSRRMCGTAEQWKLYQRREAEQAGDMVRRMQQGRLQR